MSIQPPVMELQHSCALGLAGQKNSAHAPSSFPVPPSLTPWMSLGLWVLLCETARGGCLFLFGEGVLQPLVSCDHRTGLLCLLQWGVRAEKGSEQRGRGLGERSALGWTRNHKPWVIARLQRGRKAILSQPKPWLLCTMLCLGWHADFESPSQTSWWYHAYCSVRWGHPWRIFHVRIWSGTETWKPAWVSQLLQISWASLDVKAIFRIVFDLWTAQTLNLFCCVSIVFMLELCL